MGLIGREKMRESKFYQEIVAEGELQGQRNAILQILRHRFGPEASTEFETPLTAVDDRQRLTHLVGVATDCATPDDFRRALATPRRRRTHRS
jgi:hypothetical protein